MEKTEKSKKFPDEEEIVICIVTKIFPTTIFCSLEEYGKEGVIPISEIAPGRIRNIRDYVKEGKRVVCKVLGVDEEKGHITLSLRRVTLKGRKEKLGEYEKEKNSQTILKIFFERTKVKIEPEVIDDVNKKYSSLFDFFLKVLEDKDKLSELKLKKGADELYILIKERIKPKKVNISLTLEFKTYLPDGIEKIKKILSTNKANLKYISAPYYKIEVEGEDAKNTEKALRAEVERIIKAFKEFGEAKIKE